MYGRRSRVGAHVAITVAAVALLAACARGGDGGTSRLDGSVTPPPPRDSGGGPIEPCAERGYAGTCQTATDVGALATGDSFTSEEGHIERVGGAQWLRVAFPPESAPPRDAGVAPSDGGAGDGGAGDGGAPLDGAVPTSMEGVGAPAVRFLRNTHDAYRLEIRTACGSVAGCGAASSDMATNITEWSFTDTTATGEEGAGQLSTRDTVWPAQVYVRVYATSATECGSYQIEIVR